MIGPVLPWDLTHSSDGVRGADSGIGRSRTCLHGHFGPSPAYEIVCRLIRLVVVGPGNGFELREISHRIDPGGQTAAEVHKQPVAQRLRFRFYLCDRKPWSPKTLHSQPRWIASATYLGSQPSTE